MPGFFQSRYSTAGVRCCSEDGLTCDTPDGFKCATDHVNFVDAVSLCKTNGLRLCTKDELLSEICCGTGGNCNSYAVWTSTRYLGIESFKLLFSNYIWMQYRLSDDYEQASLSIDSTIFFITFQKKIKTLWSTLKRIWVCSSLEKYGFGYGTKKFRKIKNKNIFDFCQKVLWAIFLFIVVFVITWNKSYCKQIISYLCFKNWYD